MERPGPGDRQSGRVLRRLRWELPSGARFEGGGAELDPSGERVLATVGLNQGGLLRSVVLLFAGEGPPRVLLDRSAPAGAPCAPLSEARWVDPGRVWVEGQVWRGVVASTGALIPLEAPGTREGLWALGPDGHSLASAAPGVLRVWRVQTTPGVARPLG